MLTQAEEAIVVAFRRKTMLPLDNVLGCQRDTVPNFSRSALHRCLQRPGIPRLPVEETAEKRKRDSCELRHVRDWDGNQVFAGSGGTAMVKPAGAMPTSRHPSFSLAKVSRQAWAGVWS